MRFASFVAVSSLATVCSLAALAVLSGCTETPSSFPPCVDPNNPCPPEDASTDAADGHADAGPDATPPVDAAEPSGDATTDTDAGADAP